ncbi:sugar phosphate isomerase/epimerase family protein [Candidatus Pristimantibacillus sp. PTI5]|uniref:sugar phosphate isomerase/epimerase family protein n=1 Tax=Candidatus Pristimantibacillus sp. PTI5 TaxID=3400422 RepID=UPI003B024E8D
MFPFKTALNASTLFPFQLDVEQQIQVAAEAGYEGIELWVGDIQTYIKKGGTTAQLRSKMNESGIRLVNAIAFFKWADSDEDTRTQGFMQAEEEMLLLAELGCEAVAAPPFGHVEDVTLDQFAYYFSKLSEMGHKIGVEPYLEFWGRAKKLSTLSEAYQILAKSGLKDAKILLDPFHMYTGGSDFELLKEINGSHIGIFHVNDYPESPSSDVIQDKERVFPGEGIAPSARLAKLLFDAGYRGFLSLELFHENYGQRDALEVAAYGLKKMKSAYSV